MRVHMSDCIDIVYEIPLLPNAAASELLYTKRERCEVLPGRLKFPEIVFIDCIGIRFAHSNVCVQCIYHTPSG
jgi:hypothetical protein